LKNTAVGNSTAYHCAVQCSDSGNSNTGKTDSSDKCQQSYHPKIGQ